jgi:transcription antitermination factor NusG
VTENAGGLPDSSRHNGSAAAEPRPNLRIQDAEAAWYAVCVKPNFEHVSARLLHDKGFEQYLPVYRCRRQWSDRVKDIEVPLFPRYLFCRMLRSQRSPVLSTPGVLSIVSCGPEPSVVPETEIQAVRILLRSGLVTQPSPFLDVGDRVRVRQGPLAGITGIVTARKNELHLVVSVALLQRSVTVELKHSWVTGC